MNDDDPKALHDRALAEQRQREQAAFAFIRSEAHFRHAAAIRVHGILSWRIEVTPLEAQPVRRVSGGLIRA
jgi:hypothetical protein